MEDNYWSVLIDLFRAISAPGAEPYIKDKLERELLCYCIDNIHNMGTQTKNDLKMLVKTAPDKTSLVNALCIYAVSYNHTM